MSKKARVTKLILAVSVATPLLTFAASDDSSPLSTINKYLTPMYGDTQVSGDYQLGIGLIESAIIGNRLRIVRRNMKINGVAKGLLAEEQALYSSIKNNSIEYRTLAAEVETNTLLRTADGPDTLLSRANQLEILRQEGELKIAELEKQFGENTKRFANDITEAKPASETGAKKAAASAAPDNSAIKSYSKLQASLANEMNEIRKQMASYQKQAENLRQAVKDLKAAEVKLTPNQLETRGQTLQAKLKSVSEKIGADKTKLDRVLKKLNDAKLRQAKITPKKGFIRTGLRWGARVGEILIVADVAGRVYVWNVLERDPGFSPLSRFVAESDLLGDFSKFLKKVNKDLEPDTIDDDILEELERRGIVIEDMSDLSVLNKKG